MCEKYLTVPNCRSEPLLRTPPPICSQILPEWARTASY